jgi:hypothetical protein
MQPTNKCLWSTFYKTYMFCKAYILISSTSILYHIYASQEKWLNSPMALKQDLQCVLNIIVETMNITTKYILNHLI